MHLKAGIHTSLKALLTTVIVSLLLTSCFTGIESTPTITDKDVRRQVVDIKPEDTYLNDIKPRNISTDIIPGKPWAVVDSKFKLLLNPEAQNLRINKGDTLRFKSFKEAVTVTGNHVAEIELTTPNEETVIYRTSVDYDKIKKGYPIDIPFTVDLDLVDDVRDKLLGKTFYIDTRTRYDQNDQIYYGSRFVPVKIISVDYGNEYYPIRLTLVDSESKTFRLYMSISPDSKMPRKFSTLFSISNPRDKYPAILPETWEKIIKGDISIGMTRDECRLSLGAPDNVDRQAGYSSVREIWSYNNGRYLIFSDGILEMFRK